MGSSYAIDNGVKISVRHQLDLDAARKNMGVFFLKKT